MRRLGARRPGVALVNHPAIAHDQQGIGAHARAVCLVARGKGIGLQFGDDRARRHRLQRPIGNRPAFGLDQAGAARHDEEQSEPMQQGNGHCSASVDDQAAP
ncbi:hypothetical protein D3C72_1955180 [compost metagenome]